MFKVQEKHGHGKYVAGGAVLGAGLAVLVYYAVKHGFHVKAKDAVSDVAKKAAVAYYNRSKKNEQQVPLTHPPVGSHTI